VKDISTKQREDKAILADPTGKDREAYLIRNDLLSKMYRLGRSQEFV